MYLCTERTASTELNKCDKSPMSISDYTSCFSMGYNTFENNSDQNFSDMLIFSVYLKTVYFTSGVINPCMTERRFLCSKGQYFPQYTELCL